MIFQREKQYILETLWYTVYGLYHQLLDGIYVELVGTIHMLRIVEDTLMIDTEMTVQIKKPLNQCFGWCK